MLLLIVVCQITKEIFVNFVCSVNITELHILLLSSNSGEMR